MNLLYYPIFDMASFLKFLLFNKFDQERVCDYQSYQNTNLLSPPSSTFVEA
jgi:hypothetical protein